MPSKNPPITGAAQSVSNERVREMLKGRPEPVAPPAKEKRKSFQSTKLKADEEPTAAPADEKPSGDEEEDED